MNQHDKGRVRRGVKRRLAAQDEVISSELPITPLLDVVINITLFMLATMSFVLASSEVSARTPDACSDCTGRTQDGLHLSIAITDNTVLVAGAGGVLAPGCQGRAGALVPTITRDGHEWEALTRCLARVHAAYPEEREVILSADAQVPYEDVIAAMDAARVDGASPLFPEVRLSAGLR